MQKLYRVGAYCRLSMDDFTAKGINQFNASVSIENQKELLSKYIAMNGWLESKFYCDDGWSGGNFQRPAFQQMLADAQAGVINLILVKDLSRLGRDYVEVGRYIDEIFPALGCRFVSVLDLLDSANDDSSMLHFRSLMNDYHLKDLSNKMKSVLNARKRSGQYISSNPPYGYRKSDLDSHKLEPDENTALVVRRIFDLRLTGMGYAKIAAVLNNEHIPTMRSSLWQYAIIRKILNNEVYIGNLVMNRTGNRTYKDESKICKPQEEWIRIENAHEPIILPEVWQEVQQINKRSAAIYSPKKTPERNLFSGKLICADCGAKMTANNKVRHTKSSEERRTVFYNCGRFSRSGGSVCSCHTVDENRLKTLIAVEIRQQAEQVQLDDGAVISKLANYDIERLEGLRKEIQHTKQRLQDLIEYSAKLYEDKVSGAINKNAFVLLMRQNEQERARQTEQLKTLQADLAAAEQQTAAMRNWTASIKQYLDLQMQDIDRTIIDELIDHIEIGKRQRVNGKLVQDIKIFYRFVGLVA